MDKFYFCASLSYSFPKICLLRKRKSRVCAKSIAFPHAWVHTESMTERMTFSLDDEAAAYLQSVAGTNRSAYINQLLKAEKQRAVHDAVLRANREEAEDADYQAELSDWDATLSDDLTT